MSQHLPPLDDSGQKASPASRVSVLPVLEGVLVFLAIQYGLALWRLAMSSGGMMNKFSALARDQYLGFIVGQNILMLVAYAILGVIGTFLAQPIVTLWTCKSSRRGGLAIFLRSMAVVFVIHGFCTLRLVKTRPYFLNH